MSLVYHYSFKKSVFNEEFIHLNSKLIGAMVQKLFLYLQHVLKTGATAHRSLTNFRVPNNRERERESMYVHPHVMKLMSDKS